MAGVPLRFPVSVRPVAQFVFRGPFGLVSRGRVPWWWSWWVGWRRWSVWWVVVVGLVALVALVVFAGFVVFAWGSV